MTQSQKCPCNLGDDHRSDPTPITAGNFQLELECDSELFARIQAIKVKCDSFPEGDDVLSMLRQCAPWVADLLDGCQWQWGRQQGNTFVLLVDVHDRDKWDRADVFMVLRHVVWKTRSADFRIAPYPFSDGKAHIDAGARLIKVNETLQYQDNEIKAEQERRRLAGEPLLKGYADPETKNYIEKFAGGWCVLCDKPIAPGDAVHIHHLRPVKKGGSHAPWNIRFVHRSCNLLHKDGCLACFLVKLDAKQVEEDARVKALLHSELDSYGGQVEHDRQMLKASAEGEIPNLKHLTEREARRKKDKEELRRKREELKKTDDDKLF